MQWDKNTTFTLDLFMTFISNQKSAILTIYFINSLEMKVNTYYLTL